MDQSPPTNGHHNPALASARGDSPPRASARFGSALRDRPLYASVGLGIEYAMFASGVGLALTLFATRVPLRIADRVLGLGLRDRFIELLARVSPG